MESFEGNTEFKLRFLDSKRMENSCKIKDIFICNYSETNQANYL